MVRVRFFAGFREKIGEDELRIETPDITLGKLIELLEERNVGIKELIEKNGATIAVNRKVAKLGDTVKNSDEVAIFPPVSGGSGETGL